MLLFLSSVSSCFYILELFYLIFRHIYELFLSFLGPVCQIQGRFEGKKLDIIFIIMFSVAYNHILTVNHCVVSLGCYLNLQREQVLFHGVGHVSTVALKGQTKHGH